MPGPNSCPNGDTTLMRGHVNEKFMCEKHGEKHLDVCESNEQWAVINELLPKCKIVSLREYLARRNRLRTGKTN